MKAAANFQPLNYERLTPEHQLERSRAFVADMKKRRTVRHFSSESVPFELIENAIAAAASARFFP